MQPNDVHPSAHTWVTRLAGGDGERDVMVALLFSAAIYLLAIALAAGFGVFEEFVHTGPIYLGHFGYAWVFAWLGWGTRYVATLPQRLRSAFVVSDEEFTAVIDRCFSRIFDWKSHAFGVIPAVLACFGFVAYGTRTGTLPWFPAWWSDGTNLLAKNLLLDLFYVVPVAALVYTGGSAIIAYSRFVAEVGRLTLHPVLPITRAKLRPITDFGLATGLAWSVGVALFLLLFRNELDAFALSFLGLVTALGLTMILWPQWVLHGALVRVKGALLDVLARETITDAGPAHDEELDPKELASASLGASRTLREDITWVVDGRTWVYEPKDVGSFVLTWLIPAGTLGYALLT